MTYDGPERRSDNRELIPRVGGWWLRHARTWTAAVAAHFVILSFVAGGVAVLSRRSADEVDQLERQVRTANQTAGDAKVVADFIRDCIFFPEENRCPVSELRIERKVNPANPPSTTTTSRR